MSGDVTIEQIWIPVAVVIGLMALVALLLWRKGRPFTQGDVFRASRLSSGNRLFPTQVAISPTSVIHYTPELFGRREQSIHMAHVSSVGIDTNLMFSDVIIETSGGATPIRCHGHRKKDAVRMKALIEQYQTAYYGGPDRARTPDRGNPTPVADR
ncbi:MAG TPA: hypothetical protein VNJ02_00575 [Vicinamibacterales bacterium]|nr:hypothetical protein [Vicinamibacterales bacterium]